MHRDDQSSWCRSSQTSRSARVILDVVQVSRLTEGHLEIHGWIRAWICNCKPGFAMHCQAPSGALWGTPFRLFGEWRLEELVVLEGLGGVRGDKSTRSWLWLEVGCIGTLPLFQLPACSYVLWPPATSAAAPSSDVDWSFRSCSACEMAHWNDERLNVAEEDCSCDTLLDRTAFFCTVEDEVSEESQARAASLDAPAPFPAAPCSNVLGCTTKERSPCLLMPSSCCTIVTTSHKKLGSVSRFGWSWPEELFCRVGQIIIGTIYLWRFSCCAASSLALIMCTLQPREQNLKLSRRLRSHDSQVLVTPLAARGCGLSLRNTIRALLMMYVCTLVMSSTFWISDTRITSW